MFFDLTCFINNDSLTKFAVLSYVLMIFTATNLEDLMFLASITVPYEPTPKYSLIKYPYFINIMEA